MAKNTKGGLGRGLSSLLASENFNIEDLGTIKTSKGVNAIPISQIEANPFQPRSEFEQKALEELAESIKVHGLIQPVTVRKMGNEKYQLISGERRTRASILAGLTEIPAYVRVANDQDMLEMALVENIQRENLNAVEVAFSYKRLIDECDLKQDELGDRVGKDRSTVANYIRLLKLPDEILIGIKNDEISMGHARSILGLKDEKEQIEIYQRIVHEKLSVRETEKIVKEHGTQGKSPIKKTKKSKSNDDNYSSLINDLNNEFAGRVSVKSAKNGKGALTIKFSDESELKDILNRLQ